MVRTVTTANKTRYLMKRFIILYTNGYDFVITAKIQKNGIVALLFRKNL